MYSIAFNASQCRFHSKMLLEVIEDSMALYFDEGVSMPLSQQDALGVLMKRLIHIQRLVSMPLSQQDALGACRFKWFAG